MLQRIKELLNQGESFAFETTLATKTYQNLINSARKLNYEVILLFLALDSSELAIQRVLTRVIEGGHNIPVDTIKRRFDNGLRNLFKIYLPIVDKWIIIDNSTENFEFIAEGSESEVIIRSKNKWIDLNKKHNGY